MPEPEPKVFENYPSWIISITGLQSLLVYAVGAYLVFQFGLIWGILYIIYLFGLEISIYKEGCVSCYYYGKRCAFGRGKIASLFFKKNEPQKFCQKKVTLPKLIPHILTALIPVVIGIILLIRDFNWLILILTAIPILNWFVGNPLIYGKLACLHCAQGRICCPANDFFGKKNKK